MSRLIIVSNRLPVNIERDGGGYRVVPSVGGLATGLGSFYKSYSSLWIGWPGIVLEEDDKVEEVQAACETEGCVPVFLTKDEVENYYEGFCNKTIWPLFHYFTQYTDYQKHLWDTYARVNEAFRDAVCKVAEPGDIIWVHDYHLMLLPQLIREKLPFVAIGFFLHIPFPSFEVFRQLPWRNEIIEGLLGVDLIGFHTYDYVRHFINSVRGHFGYEHHMGQIPAGGRVIKVDAFPMGIDYGRYAGAVDEPEVVRAVEKIREVVGERKVILSIDRLDYSKGIAQRLEAYDLFFERYPEYKEQVTFIIVAVPSRTKVIHYANLKRQIDELVGRVNGKHGTIGWTPVWYLYRSFPFMELMGFYCAADVALVTPLRDGMNLVAKEYVATKAHGKAVLILSEMAGTAKELGEAIIINPNNVEMIVEALREALTMTEEEQVNRNAAMQKRLKRYDIVRWANDFMERLAYIKKVQRDLLARRLTDEMRDILVSDYLESKSRLILLDYDGTLVHFQQMPEKAWPDPQLMRLLEALANDPKNEVVIISGRDKASLEGWFAHLNVGLVAEHGVWFREEGGEWEIIEPLRNDWKSEIKPILEVYVDRTPGSFIEEKEFSLVWHFRKADPELSSVRAKELKETLSDLTANMNLDVLEGSRIIETKNTGVNKGRAAMRWLAKKKKWGFILAVGDDWTDEDTFSVLPGSAYSIKVGFSPSQARFNIATVDDVRSLLQELFMSAGGQSLQSEAAY